MAGPRGQALHPYVAAIFDETRSTLAIVNIRGHDRFYCNDSFSRTFFTEVRATPLRCPSRMLGPLFLTTRSRICSCRALLSRRRRSRCTTIRCVLADPLLSAAHP